jgi:Flp pilus assembly protein TadD
MNERRSVKPEYLRKSFTQLVEGEGELAMIRREHSRLSPEDRLGAAEWSYDASMADFIFGKALAQAGQYEEALPVLDQAAALAPPDYELARNNLADLRAILARAGRRSPGQKVKIRAPRNS